MEWIPRRTRADERDVFLEGVPPHLKPSLLDWLRPRMIRTDGTGGWRFEMRVLHAYDRVARPEPPLSARAASKPGQLVRVGPIWPGFVAKMDDEELLDLVDWFVYDGPPASNRELGEMLEEVSSAWTLGERNGHAGLVRRVTPAVQAAVDQATSGVTAGALLSEAWVACYGRAPNPEEAYEKAIKAVEEAAASIVSPKNTRATLGSMIRDMKNQGEWRIDLPGAAQDVPVSMMEALWTGQESRHGGNGYRMPTQSEAETAVLLAVPLVQWFMSGNVERRSQAA